MVLNVYSVYEVSEILGINYRKVLRLIKNGDLKILKGSEGKARISEYQLESYLRGE